MTFTVAILRECEDDIEVSLACDLPSRFRIPAGIRIPAGEKSAMVTVESIDDNTPDIERGVTFTASAPGQQPASVNIILEDNDIPALELQLHPSTVAESDGPLAVSAIVKRTDNIDKLVTISLEDDSDGAIYYSQRKFEMKPGVEGGDCESRPYRQLDCRWRATLQYICVSIHCLVQLQCHQRRIGWHSVGKTYCH